MSLYDAAVSCTMADLEYLESIIAKSDSLQEIAGVSTDEELAALIRLGPMDDPWDGENHGIDELENQLFYAQIYPSETGYQNVRGPEQHGEARIFTDAEISIHRQLRESEQEDLQDSWKFYCDRVWHFAESELYEDARNNDPQLWIAAVSMLDRPGFVEREGITGMGDRLFSRFLISLGQRGEEGE